MDEMGRRFHVQKFIDGEVYAYHEAPESCQKESAQMLAEIHLALKEVKGLPEGIGQDFFTGVPGTVFIVIQLYIV